MTDVTARAASTLNVPITKRLRRLFLTSASAAALTALSAGSAAAQVAWTGATSTDWTTGANWSGGAVPTSPTAVTIDSPNRAVLGVGGPVTASTGNLFVGDTASSSLTIQNGSTLTSLGMYRIGGAGSTGTVTVTGAGSQWTASGLTLSIGAGGTGVLNIQDGATVTASGGVALASGGGVGTLNISNATLASQSLTVAAGSQVNFDNATYRATRASAIWVNSGAGTLNIAAGGLTVDSAGFNVTALSGFSGVGGLTKVGTGTVNLTTSNSYIGQTLIQEGTLKLLGGGSVAASSGVVANGTFDVSGVTGAATDIQSLGGSGVVTLGTTNLTITNAHDTFSGTFNGTGALTLTGGTETLTGDNSGFAGSTAVQGGTLAVNGVLGGAMDVLSGGRLQGIGTVGSTANAGVIAPGNSIGTLTVNGNYTGNGGTLETEAVLGGDASPADRLVVTGDTSGTTNVKVVNLGGAGAQTTDGIKIVDVGGASNGSFSLLGDYVLHGQQAVIGGAYAYTLQKNGVVTPADGDWYLRSSLVDPPPDLAARPLYQPGVPLYENFARVLFGLNSMPTLQQRVGDRYWNGDAVTVPSAVPGATAEPQMFWARTEGLHTSIGSGTATGSAYTSNQFKMQTGLDGVFLENATGRLIGGFNVQYGTATAHINSVYGNGRIDTMAYSVGGTLTWYGDNGFYVDGQGQATLFNADLKSDLVGRDMVSGNDSMGYGLSAEIGRRIGIGNEWTVTPQAQLVFSAVDFNFTDAFGTPVSLNDGNSLNSRLGLSLDHQQSWRGADGKLARLSTYAIANMYYEFLDAPEADVAGTMFTAGEDRLQGGLGLGGTYSWNDGKYAVHGEVMARGGFNDDYGVGGTGGFSMKW